MSAAEVREFLAGQRWVALGTLAPDGAAWASLAPAVLGDAALCFAVSGGSRAARNLAGDARVCCAADQFPSYYEIRGATVHGRAVRVHDAGISARLAAQLATGPLPGWSGGAVLEIWSVPLDDVFSFDFGKIQNRV